MRRNTRVRYCALRGLQGCQQLDRRIEPSVTLKDAVCPATTACDLVHEIGGLVDEISQVVGRDVREIKNLFSTQTSILVCDKQVTNLREAVND